MRSYLARRGNDRCSLSAARPTPPRTSRPQSRASTGSWSTRASTGWTSFAPTNSCATFSVALGAGGLGPKVQQGDERVPEGRYLIAGRNPKSAFHLSLRIGYPTPAQVEAARARGIDPGGDIMIHGLPNGQGWLGSQHLRSDWTAGCIAVTNEEIEWLWRAVPDGTPIEIRA